MINTKNRENMVREEIEKARSREIIKKINELMKEKEKCENCINGLNRALMGLRENESDLNLKILDFNRNDLTREIVIPEIFDGVGASAIKKMVGESVNHRNNIASDIVNVMGMIETQKGRLHEYLNVLEKEIVSLRVML